MIEKIFVKNGIAVSDLEKFLRKKVEKAGYSHSEIERTPLGTRIIIYVHKPGLIIGKSGRKIDELAEEIKEKFKIENPMIDVKEVEQPMLDANIVAYRIAKAIEKGINYKKVCNYYLEQVRNAGAIGVSIVVSGKLAGKERSRFQKFRSGFVAYSGDYAERLVEKGYSQAMIKPGIVGVEVRIMKQPIEEFKMKEGEKSESKGTEETKA
jgi:small subunit ribosomal protein S3